MIVATPSEFLAAFAELDSHPKTPASARAAFLVAPSAFTLAAESARDNHYMDLTNVPDAAQALQQHAALADALRADVPVVIFPGDPQAPDGVFPNNVFATAPGRLIVGSMQHPVRQREAQRADIRTFFTEILDYKPIDLSVRSDCVAELTGALIIDHARGVGYAGLSERCNEAGARAMHEAFGLKLTYCFELAPSEYHTNVVMALLAARAVILAADGFADPEVAKAIAYAYSDRAVWLSPAQKQAFSGNAITLSDQRVWLSAAGAAALTPAQRQDLANWGFDIGQVDLSEIEKAGGSLRCCVAEIF